MSDLTAVRRRRGRPRASGKVTELDARDEILRAAATLFSRQGIRATRVSDIAAAVGITPPSIHYHFDNLAAIVGALLDDVVVVESAAFATGVRSTPGDAAQRLHDLIAQHVERLTRGPFDLWFVAGLSDHDSDAFPEVQRRAAAWRRAVAGIVEEGVEAGAFAAIDSAVAVTAVSGLVYGALELHHRGVPVDADQIATLAVRALAGARRAVVLDREALEPRRTDGGHESCASPVV